MKLLVTIFIILSLCRLEAIGQKAKMPATPITKIVFFNSPYDYGIGVNKQIFWREKAQQDSIVIFGRRLNGLLDGKFHKLKDTILWKGKDELRYAVAFIRQRTSNKADTLYASPTLRYWLKGDKTYVDTTGYFKNTFERFLIYEN